MVAQGIHYGMGMKEYHSWQVDKSKLVEGPISCSLLKNFDPNPYRWLKTEPKEQTDSMRLGSFHDAALTDPDYLAEIMPRPSMELFEELPFPDLRTKAAKEWKAEKESQGVRVLTSNQAETERQSHREAIEDHERKIESLTKAAKEVYRHPIAGKILDGAKFQVGVVGEIGQIPAKCLIDILPSEDSDYCETLFDYKTISTGLDDESIRKAIGTYKYHWQAAFYRTLFNKVSDDRVCDDFGFIFQCVHTQEVRVVMLDSDSLMLGTRAVKNAAQNFTRCAFKGIKSQYLKRIETLELMPYHAMNEDEALTKRESEITH